MSSGNGSGRLPSLNSSAGKPGLKFKPKVVARRTKEEREASAPKIKNEETQKLPNDKKRDNGRNTGSNNQQRRMARFLNNTHVISSGPLAAGNFVSEKGNDMRRGFIKTEGGMSSLVQTGLQNIDNGNTISDDEGDESKDKEGVKGKSKFNMGREYVVHDLQDDDDQEMESDNNEELDDEAMQAKKVEELFPVRPVRIRHEDLETVQKNAQETVSSNTSREPTPQGGVKIEEDPSIGFKSTNTGLRNVLQEKETSLHNKLQELTLQQQFQSLDQHETLQEIKSLTNDHSLIWKKINKINNKPNRFILFQLPSKLPAFKEVKPKSEDGDDNTEKEQSVKDDTDDKESKDEENKTKETVKGNGKKNKSNKKEIKEVPEESLVGNIGSIRVHKSGRLSVKVGNVIMDVSRGAETTFLQDVVALNETGETPCLEALGRIDGRVVITPRF